MLVVGIRRVTIAGRCAYAFGRDAAAVSRWRRQASGPAGAERRPTPPSELAQDPILRMCPERPRHVQQSLPLPRQPHGLHPPVRIGHAFDYAIALEKIHATRERRLVDGERTLELSQVGFAALDDG